MNKVAIITGTSSGMGHSTAKILNQQGYEVYGNPTELFVPANCVERNLLKTEAKRGLFRTFTPS